MPEILGIDRLLAKCSGCGCRMRFRLAEVRRTQTHYNEYASWVECPQCGAQVTVTGSEEWDAPPGKPEEIEAALSRWRAYKSGRTAREVYGKAGRAGYHDDLELIADHFARLNPNG